MSYLPPPPPPPGSPGMGGYAAPRTNAKATWSLVLGIISIVCCGLVAGIPALILGNQAQREIAMSGGAFTGHGMAQAGRVLGIISIVLSAIYVIFFIARLATAPSGA